MKTSLKKLVAGASIVALVAMNTVFADLSLTGSGKSLSLTGSSAVDGTFTGMTATGTLSIDVTATVLPILTFDISNPSLALGNLTIGSYKTTNLTYTGITNARQGMSLAVTSNLLNDSHGNKIGAGQQANTSYKFATGATVDFTSAGTEFDTTSQNVHSIPNNGTMANTFNIGAKIDSNTIAGNYNDTLTFTVVGKF